MIPRGGMASLASQLHQLPCHWRRQIFRRRFRAGQRSRLGACHRSPSDRFHLVRESGEQAIGDVVAALETLISSHAALYGSLHMVLPPRFDVLTENRYLPPSSEELRPSPQVFVHSGNAGPSNGAV